MTTRRPGPASSDPAPPSTAPLEGLRVLEWCTGRAGSFAGLMLADLGADVVKLEPPEVQVSETDRLAFDRGKRSVVLHPRLPGGEEARQRLVAWADVLVEEGQSSAPPGAHDRDDLVRCRLSTFHRAPSVPDGTGTAEELIVQALSGNMDLTGELGGRPNELGVPLGDLMSGVYGVIGILGAVVGGTGRTVEVAELDVMVALLSYMAVGYFADGVAPTRVGTGHSTIFPYNAFRAADGEVVVAPFTQRFWRNFCTATGREDLTQVDTYKDFARRLARKNELLDEFEPVMVRRTVDEWIEVFRLHDVPAGPVLSVEGALALPQTTERGMVASIELADGRTIRTLGSPFRFAFADGGVSLPAATRPPAPGEHSDRIPEVVL